MPESNHVHFFGTPERATDAYGFDGKPSQVELHYYDWLNVTGKQVCRETLLEFMLDEYKEDLYA